LDPSPVETCRPTTNNGYPLSSLNPTESACWSPGAFVARVSFPAPAYRPVPRVQQADPLEDRSVAEPRCANKSVLLRVPQGPIQIDLSFTLSLERPSSALPGRFRPGREGLSRSIQKIYN
jgi:hypothetical protein